MFDNDVTKNYQLQDATFEILIMLAGAFLLGTLFCWALGKLRKSKRKHPYQRKTVDQQNGYRQPIQQADAIHRDKLETNTLRGKAGGAAGIIDNPSITNTNSKITDKISNILEPATTVILKKDKLEKDKIAKVKKSKKNEIADTKTTSKPPENSISEPIFTSSPSEPSELTDNFKKIEGIGPKIEKVLHTAGIKTYADLRASDTETLKAILIAASPTFKIHDPETWPYQADLAYKKDWEKLKEYQNFLMGRDR